MKKSNGVPHETTTSKESNNAQAGMQDMTPSFSDASPARPNKAKLQSKSPRPKAPRQGRAASPQSQVQKTSIEERVKRIQAQRAKEKTPTNFKEVTNTVVEQVKAFAITLIKGKPNVSKTTKDFPINRHIIGRMKRYGPAKVYRLKGYTTVGRVKKKRGRDMLKKHRNRLIFLTILGIFIVVLYVVIDPVPTIKQFLFDIGY